MIILVGVDRKSGNYQGNDYDNINLYVTDDCPATPTICGQTAYKIKIKVHRVKEVFDGLISTDADWREILGKELDISWDRYGNPLKIRVKEV